MSNAKSIAAARAGFADLLNEAHFLNRVIPVTKHERDHAYIVGPEVVRSYVKKKIDEKATENEESETHSYEHLIEKVAEDMGWNPSDIYRMLEQSKGT
jgi:hypothetical protein